MSKDVWADPIPEVVDPCNRQCGVSSVTGFCRGCFRTLTEIAKWDQLEKDEQLEIIKMIIERKNES